MKISLIITSWNAEKYIAKAIESFLAQDYANKELIILDGKSKDGTHEIIKKYHEQNPGLIKWIKEDDLGISHARNIAINHATGDLIGFLGADDFLHKDIYSQIAYYENLNPDFDIIYFNSYTVGSNSSSFDQSSATMVNRRNLIKHCPIGSGESFYYRKAVFDQVKFNEKNRYSMDYELNMFLATNKKNNSKKFIFFPINVSGVFNGSYGDSISSSNGLKQRLETIAVQLKYTKNFKEKLCILFKKKKMILKNYTLFKEIRNFL